MPDANPEIFISYSRKNKDFAMRLVGTLKQHQREAWIDLDDIPPSDEWWGAIKHGIDAAGTFVVIVTPESLASPVCAFEMRYAIENNKRIIPVMHKDPPDMAVLFGVMAALTPTGYLAELLGDADLLVLARQNWRSIEKLNWVQLRDGDDFEQGVSALLRALDEDLTIVRLHTRLLVRARLWDERRRDPSFLLVGSELDEAVSWLILHGDLPPCATDVQRALINVSRERAIADEETRAQQVWALERATQRARQHRNQALAAVILAVLTAVTASFLTGQAVQQATATLVYVELRATEVAADRALFRANDRYATGFYAAAISELKPFLDQPDVPPLMLLIAARSMSFNDIPDDDDGALGLYARYLALDADSLAQYEDPPHYVGWYEVALHHARRGRFALARQALDLAYTAYQSLSVFDQNMRYPHGADQLVRVEAAILLGERRYGEVIAALQEPIERIAAQDFNAPSYYLLEEMVFYTAVAYQAVGQQDQACKAWRMYQQASLGTANTSGWYQRKVQANAAVQKCDSF